MSGDKFLSQQFEEWMAKVEARALSFEWCIEHDFDFWWAKFLRDLTPEQAVDELFKEVNP